MVLLCGSKNWVVAEVTLKLLEGYHNRAAWRIVGMSAQKVGDELWEWSSVTEYL